MTAERMASALADRYAIEREIGAGGMATVYLAHDVRHDRKVALKVLKPELAAVVGSERFLAEIRTTANLQHPHILPLFDSGEADGFLFFVMPYVEGESLRDRLDREGEFPVEEAVRIAAAVASALDYAHRHGVIHRDIKPANILLHDGQPLVADFGIALAVSAAGGGRLTETGLSLGTPYYMSPEQATAERDPDPRSDVYALGCVLYEMLVGEPPYTGASAQAVLGKVLTTDPVPPTEHRRTIPPHVEAAVLKALEKRPADRFGSAAELSTALATPGFQPRAGPGAMLGGKAPPFAASPKLPWVLLAVSCVALVGVSVALANGRRRGPTTGQEVTRLTIALPPDQAVTSAPAISPDGRTVAFTAATASDPPQLYLRDLDAYDLELVPGSEGAQAPFFSPDGLSVAFFANGQLFRWNRAGGLPQRLVDAPSPMNGTWGEDGTIVFVPAWNGGLYRLDASAAAPVAEPILVPDGELDYAFVFPRFVPNRPEITFTSWGEDSGIWRLNLNDTSRSALVPRANSGTITASGHLLFARDGLLQPLLATAEPNGPLGDAPSPEVLSGIHQRTWSPDLWLSVSRQGTLAYVLSDMTQRSLARVDLSGGATLVGDARGVFGNLSISPESERFAVDMNSRIWLHEADGSRMRLAPENREADEMGPVWDTDGSRVFYSSNASGSWQLYVRVPGSQASELVLQRDGDQYVEAVAPDGTLAFRESHPVTGEDIWLLPPGDTARPWQVSEAVETQSSFSPDGRWLAYASDLSGRPEIWVGPVEGPGSRQQVTGGGGQAPVWSPEGDRIFYRRYSAMMAVEVVSLDPLIFGNHETLFEGDWTLPGPDEMFIKPYGVTPDGEHFIMIRREPAAIPNRIHVVLNWFEELRRLVPVM